MTPSVVAILLADTKSSKNSEQFTGYRGHEVMLLISTANSAHLRTLPCTCSSGAPTQACKQCQTEEWLAVAIDELTETIVPISSVT